MSDTIPVLWTNDDIAAGKSEQLKRQLDFIDRHGIPGVFFVIPEQAGRPLTDDAPLIDLMKQAQTNGHEFYQHGYIHTPFESGVPELWMLDFNQQVRNRFDVERLEIEQQHTLEALVRMLANGQRIWTDAFGEPSPGYRPGWGAFCSNLYQALDALGYQWVSSRISYKTSWMWNQGMFDSPVDFRQGAPLHPYTVHGNLWEYPIAGDYGFRIPNEADKIQKMVDLALGEFDHYVEQNAPMLICSHHHGLGFREDTGYVIHEKLIPALLATGKAEPMGMASLHARTADGRR